MRLFSFQNGLAKVFYIRILVITMSIRMRHTKSHTGNRRSHHGLKSPRLSTCANCEAQHIRHTVCEECGTYRGRKVIDVEAIKQKKLERKMQKRRAMGLEAEEE